MTLNLTNTSLPYNTTIPANPVYFTHIITQNIPWFFPLIMLFSFMWLEYIMTKNQQIGATKSLVVVSLAYTFFSYLVLAGGLTTSGMWFLFEAITIAAFFFEILFTSGFP